MTRRPLKMQSLSLFALLLEIAPALAGISPLMRFEGRSSWTPARETGSPTAGGDEGGLSPVPTEPARHPDFGEMELFKRYQMGSDTCGFASGFKSEAWTCFKVGATCAFTGSLVGCCAGSTPDCYSTFIRTCIDYTSGTSSVSCGTGSLCCAATSPSCFTWRFSASATPQSTYSVFNCYSSGGIGTLLDTPPILTLTSGSTSATEKTSKTDLNPSTTADSDVSTSSGPPAGSSLGSSSSPPVGAIVGGVIGGLAVIGIAVVAVVWMISRRRRHPPTTGAAEVSQPSQFGSPPVPQGAYFYQDPAHPYSPSAYYGVEQKPGQPGVDPRASLLQPQYTGNTDGTWPASSPTAGGTPRELVGPPMPLGSQGHRAELS